MNKELLEVMEVLERKKDASRDTPIEAIGNSLLTACKNHFRKTDDIKVTVNPDTCDFTVYAEKAVVENVEDDCLEMGLADTKMLNPKYEIGDTAQIPLDSEKFGRIATQSIKNMILQKIREEKRKTLYSEYYMKKKDVTTGVVRCYLGGNVSISLGRVDIILNESGRIKGETFCPMERVKVYVVKVGDTPKDPRVSVSRIHSDLVKRLFESGMTKVRDGTMEVKAIAREAGSGIGIAVKSNDTNVDPVDACVSLNGFRVSSVISELKGEGIDIINWNGNPTYLIENALSPAKVIYAMADEEGRETQVIMSDYQLSLTIGKEGQNARLTARLTGLKTGIKSETQTREIGLFKQMGLQYDDTPSEAYEEETEETESYREYEENYQGGGNEQ